MHPEHIESVGGESRKPKRWTRISSSFFVEERMGRCRHPDVASRGRQLWVRASPVAPCIKKRRCNDKWRRPGHRQRTTTRGAAGGLPLNHLEPVRPRFRLLPRSRRPRRQDAASVLRTRRVREGQRSDGVLAMTWPGARLREQAPHRTAHKTRSVFDRYNIVSEQDLREAAAKLNAC